MEFIETSLFPPSAGPLFPPSPRGSSTHTRDGVNNIAIIYMFLFPFMVWREGRGNVYFTFDPLCLNNKKRVEGNESSFGPSARFCFSCSPIKKNWANQTLSCMCVYVCVWWGQSKFLENTADAESSSGEHQFINPYIYICLD